MESVQIESLAIFLERLGFEIADIVEEVDLQAGQIHFDALCEVWGLSSVEVVVDQKRNFARLKVNLDQIHRPGLTEQLQCAADVDPYKRKAFSEKRLVEG